VTPEPYTYSRSYELWSVASGNLIADVDSEAEAIEATLAYLTPSAIGPAVDVSLVVYDDDQPVRALEGADLASRAGLTDDTRRSV
jgi:hypothetical protein